MKKLKKDFYRRVRDAAKHARMISFVTDDNKDVDAYTEVSVHEDTTENRRNATRIFFRTLQSRLPRRNEKMSNYKKRSAELFSKMTSGFNFICNWAHNQQHD